MKEGINEKEGMTKKEYRRRNEGMITDYRLLKFIYLSWKYLPVRYLLITEILTVFQSAEGHLLIV